MKGRASAPHLGTGHRHKDAWCAGGDERGITERGQTEKSARPHRRAPRIWSGLDPSVPRLTAPHAARSATRPGCCRCRWPRPPARRRPGAPPRDGGGLCTFFGFRMCGHPNFRAADPNNRAGVGRETRDKLPEPYLRVPRAIGSLPVPQSYVPHERSPEDPLGGLSFLARFNGS